MTNLKEWYRYGYGPQFKNHKILGSLPDYKKKLLKAGKTYSSCSVCTTSTHKGQAILPFDIELSGISYLERTQLTAELILECFHIWKHSRINSAVSCVLSK